MKDKMDLVYEGFIKSQDVIRKLDECNSTEKGSCVACSELDTNIFKVFDMKLCEVCASRVYEYAENRVIVEKLNPSTVKQLLYEAVIFFDMSKVQNDAEAHYNGDMKALFKAYGLSVYKFFPDKIDFQTPSSKSRLNKAMLDYDGEFATNAAAMKATADFDGTMAPLKVRGQGIVTASPTQAHANPTTPVKTPPIKPTTSVTTNSVGTPLKVEFFVNKDRGYCEKVDESATSYTFKIDGLYGAKDANYVLMKNEVNGNLDKFVYEFISNNLSAITNKRVKPTYSLIIYTEDFDCILNVDSIKKAGALKYILDWANPAIHANLKINNLELTVSSSINVEDQLRPLVINKLNEVDIIPSDFRIKLCDLKIDGKFKQFHGSNYAYTVWDGTGGKFDIFVDIEDYQDDKKVLNLEIEKHLQEFDKDASASYKLLITNPATMKDVQFQAGLIKGSSLRPSNNLAYNVKGDPSIDFDVNIDRIKNIKDQLAKAIGDYLRENSKTTADVSQTKKELLTTSASPTKEMLLNRISKWIEAWYTSKDSSVDVVDLPIRGGVIQEIIVKVTDLTERDVTNANVAVNFRDKTDVLFGKIKHDVKDFGLDSSGNAYTVISIIDRNIIDKMVKEFKLDEFFNLKQVANLSYLVEGLKRRKN